MSRLLEKYRSEVIPALKESLGYKNELALPRLEKIVISMGIGRAIENKNLISAAEKDLRRIAGQKPATCQARRSVAGFKLRQGQNIGLKVTLRGKRAYEFLDRLISLVIPRLRDFRGLSPKSFDHAGNYNMGISEQVVFPEINLDEVEFVQGMNITLGVRAKTKDDSYHLLKQLGFPFREA